MGCGRGGGVTSGGRGVAKAGADVVWDGMGAEGEGVKGLGERRGNLPRGGGRGPPPPPAASHRAERRV